MGHGYVDPHFLNLALAGNEWSASRPGRFAPGKTFFITHRNGWTTEPVWTTWRSENS
jgi:hypothetical protein